MTSLFGVFEGENFLFISRYSNLDLVHELSYCHYRTDENNTLVQKNYFQIPSNVSRVRSNPAVHWEFDGFWDSWISSYLRYVHKDM